LVKWEKQTQYKPNTNPIQTQYKANSNPIQSQFKPNTKPIQTQFLSAISVAGQRQKNPAFQLFAMGYLRKKLYSITVYTGNIRLISHLMAKEKEK